MLVLPVAAPPGGSRPAMSRMTVFGTCQVATRCSGGRERTVPLTSTSTFGMVYDASPRSLVCERIDVAAVVEVLYRHVDDRRHGAMES